MSMPLILASKSPRRQELLREMGIPFSVVLCDTEEIVTAIKPEQVPLINAERKAEAVAALHPESLVLGADTVIAIDGQVIGKPKDKADAKRMLRLFSGRSHEVITGVALICKKRAIHKVFSVATQVRFLPLSEEVIEEYLQKVHVLDKAGAYAIQEYGQMIIAGIDGEFDNVVGLPTETLRRELATLLKQA